MDSVVPKTIIESVCVLIRDDLIENMIRLESCSIKNFGTLNPYSFLSCGRDRWTQTIRPRKLRYSIKFHSSTALKRIVAAHGTRSTVHKKKTT